MLQSVKEYIKGNNLLGLTDKVIVGFSGGADSVALLHALHTLKYDCVAAHCNFHLRGDESNRDEQFAREFAESLSVPFLKTDFDTIGYAEEHKISIEMAARELRYHWFEKILLKEKASVVAVAHHEDDHVETILLNLIRGTGIKGLTGIQAKREHVIRPLLQVRKTAILAYIKENKLGYVNDSTNTFDIYMRNFIRLRLIPMLETMNPSVKEAIVRMGNHLKDVDIIYRNYIRQATETVWKENQILIPELKATVAPEAVLFEILSPLGYTSSQLTDIYHSLDSESGKLFESVNGDTVLIKDRERLLLVEKKSKDEQVYSIDSDTINYPVKLSFKKVPIDQHFQIIKDQNTAVLDADKIVGELSLRTWREGDWFVPLGMQGRKKLSDYYSDNKFSLDQKDHTWLLCLDDEIIWVIGHRIDNRYSIQNASKNALIVFFLPD